MKQEQVDRGLRVGGDRQLHGQADAVAGIDLGRPEAGLGHDPVDGETTPVADDGTQLPTEGLDGVGHVGPLAGRRIPEVGRAGVQEPAGRRSDEGEHLGRPHHDDVVGKNQAVHAAGHPIEEGHDSDPVVVLPESLGQNPGVAVGW